MRGVNKFINSIVEFCNFARSKGLNIGVKETIDALQACELETISERSIFKFTLRTILCSSREEFEIFDLIFENFWQTEKAEAIIPNRKQGSQAPTISSKQKSALATSNKKGTDVEEGGIKGTTGASAIEKLQQTDFSNIPSYDVELLEQIAITLWRRMNYRLRRRYKNSRKPDKINLRRTIRMSLSHGGEPLDLAYRKKRKDKSKLLVFLDVSGSMERYSFFYLRFIHILQQYFRDTEVYLFSTKLRRITLEIRHAWFSDILIALEEETSAWSGGTTIGSCLRDFNLKFSSRHLSRNTIVLFFSDGLDTDNPDVLDNELLKIKNQTKKIIWINPLKGMKNYQPLTRSLKKILPQLDQFLSAHNLDSFTELEEYLTNVI